MNEQMTFDDFNFTHSSQLEGFRSNVPDKRTRRGYILGCLSNSTEGMTSEEIMNELYRVGIIPFKDMNMVRPRITELKEQGLIEAIGRRLSSTGISTTVWRLC